MRHKIILLLSIVIFIAFSLSPNTAQAISQTDKEQLLQQIEALKQEIFNLRTLFSNSLSQKKINAQSYLAINLSDNSVLLSKNPDKSYPIASITKLMSAIIVLENIDANSKIKLTEEMLKPTGNSSALFSGLEISAENLLKASLIQSSNDATEALEYFMEKKKFLTLMNQKAKELKMANTIFYDVHGLNPDNTSSASDLVKLLTYIYKNHPEILSITKNNNLWLPDQTGKLLKFTNLNSFYPLATFIGGKTGYLVEAKQTFASVFNINGKPVAIILLYSNNHQADTFAILKKIKI